MTSVVVSSPAARSSGHSPITRAVAASVALLAAITLVREARAVAQIGTVLDETKISATSGGFGVIEPREFGTAVAALGDIDGNGADDLAVAEGFGTSTWILFLAPDGTIERQQRISTDAGGQEFEVFHWSLAPLGDLDGDGVNDLAVGAPDYHIGPGAVWILFLEADGTVKAEQKIGAASGGFGGTLDVGDAFGAALATIGDLDGDGVVDLAVGAWGDDDGAQDTGAIWILFLEADGTVKDELKISATSGGFGGTLEMFDAFGYATAALGDIDGNGSPDLAVGALAGDHFGDPGEYGEVWILLLESDGSVASEQMITSGTGGFEGTLTDGDFFGSALAGPGDLDGDGVNDLAVGAGYDIDGGAVWILFLDADGTVESEQKISATSGGLEGPLQPFEAFSTALAALGDRDGNGVGDIAVGAPFHFHDQKPFLYGTVWMLDLASDGTVEDERTLSHLDFHADTLTTFGIATASIGDLDGDGVGDLAVGASGDDDGAPDAGAAWILFMQADGTVKSEQKISALAGGFDGDLEAGDGFGRSVAPVGDLDGDGVTDLAVGALWDDDGEQDSGAVWILFLRHDGTVKSEQKISSTSGELVGPIAAHYAFGVAVAHLGDLDGDGTNELAVGSFAETIWILSLAADGTVAHEQEISGIAGGYFGSAMSAIGDLDENGVSDLAVGAQGEGSFNGAVWILFLAEDGTVESAQKIDEFTGGLNVDLADGTSFGSGVAGLGDVDRDGVNDLAVGAFQDSDGAQEAGAIWILFLERNGTVRRERKISATSGGFGKALGAFDGFGISVAPIGNFSDDDRPDLAVGALGDGSGDGTLGSGAVWILSIEADPPVVEGEYKISATQGGFVGPLYSFGRFGASVASAGDLDGDGVEDLAVGAPAYVGSNIPGDVWFLFMNSDGTVKAEERIGIGAGGFGGLLSTGDLFGSAIAPIGDLDGDGVNDMAVGAPGEDDGGQPPFDDLGAIWILFMNSNGTVKEEQKISATSGDFEGTLSLFDSFGSAITSLGDLDGDGVNDLAVGALGDDDGGQPGTFYGAVWILFMNEDGTVKAEQKISATSGGFGGALNIGGYFGASVAALGDLDGDGVTDLAVGAPNDADSNVVGSYGGAVWILFLDDDGTVKAEQKISATSGGFGVQLEAFDSFGGSVAALGDLDGDGVTDLAVGAPGDNDGSPFLHQRPGAVWVLLLESEGTVKTKRKVSATAGELMGPIEMGDSFGTSVTGIGDFDDDGRPDVVVGAFGDDDGQQESGAIWIILLDLCSSDFDADGDIGFADLVQMLIHWGSCAVPPACQWDLDHDGVVGSNDATCLLDLWGECF